MKSDKTKTVAGRIFDKHGVKYVDECFQDIKTRSFHEFYMKIERNKMRKNFFSK